MKRRAFLKSAAAVLPVAGLADFALAQAAAPASTELHLVAAGEDRFGETHSLGFSTIRFKVATKDSGGDLFVVEHNNLVKGGPPLHLHLYQDEWFYVMEGEVTFQVGGARKTLHAGDSILGPRNVPHTFCAMGAKPARMVIAFTPAGKMEEFFRTTAIPGGPPMDAEMFRRFEMKYVGPSPFAS